MPDNWRVSPRHDMNSLRTERIRPIDVFEDAIKGWILDYASKLAALNEDHAGMAIAILVAAYPETIECYSSGQDSKGKRLTTFFTNGMKRIFPELAKVAPDEAIDTICDHLRNGLYHASMLKGNVVLVPKGEAVTYSAKERQFEINPFEFLKRVQQHFDEYVSRLRSSSPEDEDLRRNFMTYWNMRCSDVKSPEDSTDENSLGNPASALPSATGGPVTSTSAPGPDRGSIRKM